MQLLRTLRLKLWRLCKAVLKAAELAPLRVPRLEPLVKVHPRLTSSSRNGKTIRTSQSPRMSSKRKHKQSRKT